MHTGHYRPTEVSRGPKRERRRSRGATSPNVPCDLRPWWAGGCLCIGERLENSGWGWRVRGYKGGERCDGSWLVVVVDEDAGGRRSNGRRWRRDEKSTESGARTEFRRRGIYWSIYYCGRILHSGLKFGAGSTARTTATALLGQADQASVHGCPEIYGVGFGRSDGGRGDGCEWDISRRLGDI